MNPYDVDRFRGMNESQIRPPIELDFLGWRSDTHTLQRAGWQFTESMSPNIYNMQDDWHFEMRHPEHRISGMTQPMRFSQLWKDYHRGTDSRLTVTVQLGHVTVQTIGDMRPYMYPVDTSINMERRLVDPYDIYHQPYFRKIDDSKDMFLRKATINEIMDIALSKQEPEQERIREKMRRSKDLSGIRGEEKARLIMVA